MGCSAVKSFEDEVRNEVFRYINALNIAPESKEMYKQIINEDLKKKSAAFKSYHYEYKEEDKNKVVQEYKEMIESKLNIKIAQPNTTQ
jgi:hypothetical protein